MGLKRWRLGIRPQLTVIVLMAAVLSTVATLAVTESAVLNYVTQQAEAQEQQHMSIANLVLQTGYGQNVSISSENSAPCTFKSRQGVLYGCLTADSPGVQSFANYANDKNAPNGKYRLNGDADYVDQVQHYILGEVSVYQCTDQSGDAIVAPDGNPCVLISSTFRSGNGAGSASSPRDSNYGLDPVAAQKLRLQMDPNTHKWASNWNSDGWITDPTAHEPSLMIHGTQYIGDFAPILSPQKDLIGVLFVGVKYDEVTSVVANTTIELVIIGTVIMVVGVVLALFVASAIVGTLQRAARQVGGASERFGAIAAQQASGSTQQVWAINAINQALQSLAETANDISRRSDQLAQMGNQVLQRRAEISPTQIDSLIAYITRSVRDISVASRQQVATYERMTGAMQAVMEVAEQVAGDSQQTTENAERLELVVQQLRQLVGVSARTMRTATLGASTASASGISQTGDDSAVGGRQRTVQAVRPMRGGKSGRLGSRPEMAGARMPADVSRAMASGPRGGRPAGDMGTGSSMGAMGGQGMLVAGGAPGRGGAQAQQGGWMMPNGGGGMPFGGAPPAPGVGAPQAPGSPMNPLMRSGPSGPNWSMPGPNSGPQLGSGPNSGPQLGSWPMPGPPSGPNVGWPRPDANSAPNMGANGGRRAPGLPALGGLPDMGDDGADYAFPWTRRE
jgi:hypothetical protein